MISIDVMCGDCVKFVLINATSMNYWLGMRGRLDLC